MRRWIGWWSAASAVLALGLGLRPAAANTINRYTDYGNGGDSYITSKTPTDSYGDSSEIDVGQISQNPPKPALVKYVKGYIRFDLSGINTGSIKSASLTLNVIQGSTGSTVDLSTPYHFEVFGLAESVDNNWIEDVYDPNSLTFQNSMWFNPLASANHSKNAFYQPQLYGGSLSNPLATFDIVGKGIGTTVKLDSSAFPQLVSFLKADNDGSVTFLIRRTTDGYTPSKTYDYIHAFASKENESADGPLLTLVVNPEPSTLLLLGTGLVGIAAGLRRRGRAKVLPRG